MNDSERAVRAHLEQIERDRATVEHERQLLTSWEKSLDREERMARRALEFVDESGQTRMINPITQRPHVPTTKPEQRDAVTRLFTDATRVISQRELERLSTLTSGTVSRVVRDLEAQGSLFRVGRTPKGSPLWTPDKPSDDPR